MTGSKSKPSLRIQSVLYRTDAGAVARAFTHALRAVEKARQAGLVDYVEMVWGDCSPQPVLDEAAQARLAELAGDGVVRRYVFFGENKGHGGAQNALFNGCGADYLLVLNPDVLMAPDCLVELMRPFRVASTGTVEARQLPIEHPKDYSVATGETGWASGACCLIDGTAARQVGLFDADSFFLYCDDVDLSWRLRLSGRRIVFQPSAVGFHDKRLKRNGAWSAGDAEAYYSAEAALFLAHKWSRPDLVDRHLRAFHASKETHLHRAAETFERRRTDGGLCAPLDPKHTVAEFIDGDYAVRRFRL
jgi:GT2 family glycosyltransferase